MKIISFMVHNKLDDEEGRITALNLKAILIPFQCCFLCLFHKWKNHIFRVKLFLNFFWRQRNILFYEQSCLTGTSSLLEWNYLLLPAISGLHSRAVTKQVSHWLTPSGAVRGTLWHFCEVKENESTTYSQSPSAVLTTAHTLPAQMSQKPPEPHITVDLCWQTTFQKVSSLDGLQRKAVTLWPLLSRLLYFISVLLFSRLDSVSSLWTPISRWECLPVQLKYTQPLCCPHIGRFVPLQGGEKEEFHILLIRTGCIGWKGPPSHCRRVIEPIAWEEEPFLPCKNVNVREGIANYIS